MSCSEQQHQDVVRKPTKDELALGFHIPEVLKWSLIASQATSEQQVYWSHTFYRDHQNRVVKVSYATNLESSESLAKKFLKKNVLGFDMEWKFQPGRNFNGIKNNVSLIQLACEDEIGLFHIALHSGSKLAQLLAPSLRKIIESPSITKAGVAILHADSQRLKTFMRLKPRSLFELSHLYRLVKYSKADPQQCNKHLVSLSKQAEGHLGFPLFKGSVRCSNWTKALTEQQLNYAATDAYASFMLYHVMNEKRKALKPTPPLPDFGELFLPIRLAAKDDDLGDSEAEDMVTAIEQLATQEEESAREHESTELAVRIKRPELDKSKFRMPPAVLASTYQELSDGQTSAVMVGELDQAGVTLRSLDVHRAETSSTTDRLERNSRQLLSALRALLRRLSLMSNGSLHPLIPKKTLQDIASQRPRTIGDICRIPGAGQLLIYCKSNGVDLRAFLTKYGPLPRVKANV